MVWKFIQALQLDNMLAIYLLIMFDYSIVPLYFNDCHILVIAKLVINFRLAKSDCINVN
jgi:hypothetical protein